MNSKKTISAVLLALLFALMLTSCTTHSTMSFTFNVETGDCIKVDLDTSNGLTLSQENGEFHVKNGDQKILDGIFTTKENYDSYMGLKDTDAMNVIEEGKTGNNNDYLFYECESDLGTEYDFIVWVEGSNTGVLVGSLTDQETAKNAFDSLTISLE
ncbi:MAG: hypothetical protein J1E96_03110 [Ruminococcus sp.]|nr:hypothetical protein [Ruminococcus sp.]